MEAKKFKDSNTYTIHGFMLNELKLKNYDLLVFSLIYGFSQDSSSRFFGSLNYLMGAIGASKNTVLKSLRGLEERGLIAKLPATKNGKDINYYWQTLDEYRASEGSSYRELPNDERVVQTVTEGSSYREPNNNIYNNKSLLKIKMSELSINEEKTIIKAPKFTVEVDKEKEGKYFKIAESFRRLFIENIKSMGAPQNSQINAVYQTYVDPIRLLYEKDGVSDIGLQNVYRLLSTETTTDAEFWKKNIRSTSKLREKITELLIAYNKPNGKPRNNN